MKSPRGNRGQVQIFVFLVIVVMLSIWQVARVSTADDSVLVEDHWAKFAAYNSSAESALLQLREFAHQRQLPLPLVASPAKSSVCVGVASARRKNSPIKYLRQTLMGLVSRMTKSDNVYIHVFNVDRQPELHTDVDEIRDLFVVSDVKAKPAVRMDRKLQEGLDFADILTEMHSWGCPSVLFLEDDALAQEHWVERVHQAVAGAPKHWFATRLYVSNPLASRIVRPGLTDLDQGYNAVAVLFNRERLPSFVSAIRRAVDANFQTGDKRHFEAKDVFLTEYAAKVNATVQAFEPPIFQHTGIFSSIVKRSAFRIGSYMQAPNFASEGVAIRFNPDDWS